jgi:tetratricopeptide (TPR) repeat protein
MCFRASHELTRAIEDCKQALKLNPNHIKANYLIGWCMIQGTEITMTIPELKIAFSHMENAYQIAKQSDENADLVRFLRIQRRQAKRMLLKLLNAAYEDQVKETEEYISKLFKLAPLKDEPEVTRNLRVDAFLSEIRTMISVQHRAQGPPHEIPHHLIAPISLVKPQTSHIYEMS